MASSSRPKMGAKSPAKASELIPGSMGFVFTHGKIADKLGEKELKSLGAETVLVYALDQVMDTKPGTLRKAGGLEELTNIRNHLKATLLSRGILPSQCFIYMEANACFSTKNIIPAAFLLSIFPEMGIGKFSVHGFPGTGGNNEIISPEELKAFGGTSAIEFMTTADAKAKIGSGYFEAKAIEVANQLKAKVQTNTHNESKPDDLVGNIKGLTISTSTLAPRAQQSVASLLSPCSMFSPRTSYSGFLLPTPQSARSAASPFPISASPFSATSSSEYPLASPATPYTPGVLKESVSLIDIDENDSSDERREDAPGVAHRFTHSKNNGLK